MEQQIVGLDVSKAWLDGYVASSGRRLRVGNDAGGVQELVRALGDRAACLVVMEASGGYMSLSLTSSHKAARRSACSTRYSMLPLNLLRRCP